MAGVLERRTGCWHVGGLWARGMQAAGVIASVLGRPSQIRSSSFAIHSAQASDYCR